MKKSSTSMKANNVLKNVDICTKHPKGQDSLSSWCVLQHILVFICISFVISESRLVMLPCRTLIKSRWDETTYQCF